MTPGRTVFVLTHVQPADARLVESSKMIGVYATRGNAEAAIARIVDKPGFRDCPYDFVIAEYVVDRDEPDADVVTDG